MAPHDPADFLTRVFQAGVAAADPERATRQAVAALDELAGEAWVIAIGKGAHGMARGARAALEARGTSIAGGFVVGAEAEGGSGHHFRTSIGDHPVPAEASEAAAARLAHAIERVEGHQDALVLISGGATSLIATPVDGVATTDLRTMFSALLASGADIGVMNAIRRRVLRFGAGRLALSIPARRIHCLIASDVIGNDTTSIGSGPCVATGESATDARARAMRADAWDALPAGIRQHLDAVIDGRIPDIPSVTHPRFATTTARVILSRDDAVRGAATEATGLGARVELRESPLTGEASRVGAAFARDLARHPRGATPTCVIWSGETTVTLGTEHGVGGRCQEFALACALELEAAGKRGAGITVLAAGTDGRDGPTEAAGAIADSRTCERIRAKGPDPTRALREHNSHHALDAASASFTTGLTGTNVNDLVIAIIQ